jgi:hypothetical protein
VNKKSHNGLGGQSDHQLIELSKNRRGRNGFSVWATWESERTSFGKTFRKLIKYPRFLPLFFSSDHSVDMLTSYRENEANPSYPLYLTWNKEKCSKLRNDYGVDAIHVRHPWISYRNRKFSVRNKEANGTLLFWPHSSEHLIVQLDMEKVKQVLSGIPERYKPISICISAHDVKLGLLPNIRTLNYPIYTVGNVQDQRFVDRFYTLVNNFRFSAGFFPGSHIYYLHEFGIPYLAFDYSVVTMSSHGSTAIADGVFDLLAKDYPEEHERKIFDDWYARMREFSDEVSEDQMTFALKQLGFDSDISDIELRKKVYKQLAKNFRSIPKMYFYTVLQIVRDKKG